MRHAAPLGRAELRGADVHAAVELHRVGVDDLAAEPLGQRDARARTCRWRSGRPRPAPGSPGGPHRDEIPHAVRGLVVQQLRGQVEAGGGVAGHPPGRYAGGEQLRAQRPGPGRAARPRRRGAARSRRRRRSRPPAGRRTRAPARTAAPSRRPSPAARAGRPDQAGGDRGRVVGRRDRDRRAGHRGPGPLQQPRPQRQRQRQRVPVPPARPRRLPVRQRPRRPARRTGSACRSVPRRERGRAARPARARPPVRTGAEQPVDGGRQAARSPSSSPAAPAATAGTSSGGAGQNAMAQSTPGE